MEKEYAKLIINDLIDQKKPLFICSSKKQRSFTSMLISYARNKKINDIYANYFDVDSNYTKWKEYIVKNASFLFVFDDDYENVLATRICEGFIAKEIDISYLIVPTLRTLTKYNLKSELPKSNIELNDKLLANKDIVSNIRNMKINRIMMESLTSVNLKMEFNSNVKSVTSRASINSFPYHGIEFFPKENTVNGYIEASGSILVDGLKIDEFEGFIRNSSLLDFDCANFHEEAKKLFERKNQYKIYSFNLPSCIGPLEMNDSLILNSFIPSITLISKDGRLINIPIKSKSLVVDSITDDKKGFNLYRNESINPKLLIRK